MLETYCKSHNVGMLVNEPSHNLMFPPKLVVSVCDAMDGYLRSENYYVSYDNVHGFSYGCYHDSYELKKDIEAMHRLIMALDSDYNSLITDVWFGACVKGLIYK